MPISKSTIVFILMMSLLILISLNSAEWDTRDGFFSQMLNIKANGFSFDLTLIHGLRYVIMFPFISFKQESNILFLVLGMFIYLLPYLYFLKSDIRFTNKIIMSISMVLFMFLLSERTFLTMLGGFYLFLYLTEIKKKYFIIYAFVFSILSSGNVLVFIIYLLLFSKYIFENKKFLKLIIFSITMFLFSFSLMHKYEFFIIDLGGISSLIYRSTIFTSYEYNQTGRLVFVSSFLIILVFVIFMLTLKVKLTEKNSRVILYLLVAIITFLFEGIAFYSYLPVFIYVSLSYFKIGKRHVQTNF